MAYSDIIRADSGWSINDIADLIDGLVYGKQTYAGVTSGSSTVYTATLPNSPSSYFTGMQVTAIIHTACGITPTLNLNALGAKTIVGSRGLAIKANDLVANQLATFVYYSNNFYLTENRVLDMTSSNIGDTTAVNTTSTTAVDITSTNLAFTVPTGQSWMIDYTCMASFSHSAANGLVNLGVFETSLRNITSIKSPDASTSGDSASATASFKGIYTAGTYTIKTQFYVNSGTGYCRRRYGFLNTIRVS